MKIVNINKGIRAYLIEDEKFIGCSIAVLLKMPLCREDVTKNALLVNVLGSGSKKYPSLREINMASGSLYGGRPECINVKKGDYQLLEFYTQVINREDNIKNALDILRELIFDPLVEGEGFKNDYVEREKTALKAAIESIKDDKREYAKHRLVEEMFKDEGFGVNGDGYVEDLAEITPENLYDHYKKIIKRAEMDIILVGNFNADSITRGLKEFDKGERTLTRENINCIVPNETNRVFESMEVRQGKLCVGIRTKAEKAEYYPLIIANEIFGGGSDSRLFMKVREKDGLCYYISSGVIRTNGSIIVQAGISEENYERVIETINNELNNFDNITDEEIKGAKKNILKKYKSSEDDPQQIMDFCLGGILWGGAYLPGDADEKIEKAEHKSVRNAFRDTYIDTIYFLK